MGSYYYLAATLPYLHYGQNPPMSSAAFKKLAEEELNPDDAALLELCTLDPAASEKAAQHQKKHSVFIDRFRNWERTLRLNLARGRAQKMKREAVTIEAPDFPSDAAAIAKAALIMDSPLEAELYLDKARWDIIDSLQGISLFSENAIYAYLLKLLLMERRAAFNIEEGITEYKALYNAILGEAK